MRFPTRHAALAVGVAALLVTAGCLGGTSPTSSDAPAANETADGTAASCTYNATTTTTDSGTWSPDVSVEQYPPGVADNGTLVNASRLVDAHFAATANRSTELSTNWESPTKDFVKRLVQSPTRATYYSTFDGETSSSSTPKTEKVYVNRSQHYLQFTARNETLYQVGQNTTYHGSAWTKGNTFGPQFGVRGHLARGNYTVNGTVERDGRTFVQLTADDGAPPGTRESFLTYDGTALVTPEGVVHEVNESFGTGTNGSVEKRYEGSVTLNTDVEWCGAPSWTADLPHLSLSIVEGGRAVEIRNTGGAALPANTSFDVTGGEQPHYGTEGHPSRGDVKGTVTTDERLEPGEAVYVTAGAEGTASSFALHDDPTRGEYDFGNAGLTGGHGDFWYWLATGIEPWSEAE